MTTFPTCSRRDDTGGRPCPNVAVAGTTECLEHAEPSPDLHGNGYTGVYSRGTGVWPTPGASEPAPMPPARPYPAVHRNGGQHPDRLGQLVHASAVAIQRSAERRARLFARAIGWFRR